MRVQFSTLLLLASCTALVSCVSPKASRPPVAASPKASAAKKPAAAVAKAGQKFPVQSTLPESDRSDLKNIFTRLSDPSMQLLDDDVRFATSLHPAAAGSLEEAILVTTQLRLLKLQVDQSSSFQSRDLYESKTEETTPQGPSMERMFQNLQLDLAATFKNNSHLKTPASLELGRELVEKTQNSAAFTALMRQTLDEESTRLAAANPPPPASSATGAAAAITPPLAPQDGPSVATPAPASTAAVPSSEIYQSPSGDVKTGPTDLKRTDALLMQAQKMADKGEFKQAIDSVARIESQDPFFEQAREKIRVYSNRAVQDLRQKAALAFQNALPLNDSQAKQAYLVQAKTLLEKALQDYPSAEQLDTVKENLAVIARDLDTIAKDSAPDGAPKSQ